MREMVLPLLAGQRKQAAILPGFPPVMFMGDGREL
jgi:hypothetical protein